MGCYTVSDFWLLVDFDIRVSQSDFFMDSLTLKVKAL